MAKEKKVTRDTTLMGENTVDIASYNAKKATAQKALKKFLEEMDSAVGCWLEELNALCQKHQNFLSSEEIGMAHENFRLMSELRLHFMDDSRIIHIIMNERKEFIHRATLIRKKTEKILQDAQWKVEDLDFILNRMKEAREK